MARVVRGQVISLRTELFVEAARVDRCLVKRGSSVRHILPNLLSVVIVYLTLTIPRVMLFEAFLSFLGLGVEPPDVSWGLLANEGIKVITPVKIYWWLIVFPSLGAGHHAVRAQLPGRRAARRARSQAGVAAVHVGAASRAACPAGSRTPVRLGSPDLRWQLDCVRQVESHGDE